MPNVKRPISYGVTEVLLCNKSCDANYVLVILFWSLPKPVLDLHYPFQLKVPKYKISFNIPGSSFLHSFLCTLKCVHVIFNNTWLEIVATFILSSC